MKVKLINKKKGVALLISVLILSTVLGVGITLLNAVIKQSKIASSAEQSVLAIYAADSGVECALFWDIRGHEASFYGDVDGDSIGDKVFATSTGHTPFPVNDNIDCNGTDISNSNPSIGWTVSNETANSAKTTFKLDFSGGSCAIVEVDKESTGPGTYIKTIVLSRGYNVACSDIGTDLRAIERAIKVTY